MLQHDKAEKKASVMGIVLLFLSVSFLNAMEDGVFKDEIEWGYKTPSYNIESLLKAVKNVADKASDIPVIQRARGLIKNQEVVIVAAPEIEKSEIKLEEIITNNKATPAPSNNSGWSMPKFESISFTPILESQTLLYGIGALGILTVGTVSYVLYKKGIFTKIATIAKKYPWCTAAVTGVAAIATAAGILYYQGATKETVTSFLMNIKTQIQDAPNVLTNSIKKLVGIA